MVEFEKQPFYTPTELGKIFKVDPSTVLSWIHQGALYAVQLGPKTYRIPLAAVMARVNPTPPRRIEIDASEELAADERRPERALQAR
ncbi:MAG: helix-turn-helix domain-containing protein [Candidatus Limnocylindria bacterium]